MLEAGIPDKALQLLTAAGSRIGDALTESPDVDLVSFTGGLQTGRRIIKACAGTVKRCTVELGGKSEYSLEQARALRLSKAIFLGIDI